LNETKKTFFAQFKDGLLKYRFNTFHLNGKVFWLGYALYVERPAMWNDDIKA